MIRSRENQVKATREAAHKGELPADPPETAP
jgi:hypothetical protein